MIRFFVVVWFLRKAKENKFWSFPLFFFFLLLFLFIRTVESFHLNLGRNDPSRLFGS